MNAIDELAALLKLTDNESRPNLNLLLRKIQNIDALALNVKYFGYELARALTDALPKEPVRPPQHIGLKSKPSTQADIESEWVATWCNALKIPVVYHRKIWELCYVLQALYEHGCLSAGTRGLGFGCGEEAIPSYFSSRHMHVLVSDIDPTNSGSTGWISSAQHTTKLDKVFKPHLVDRETLEKYSRHRYVDMNNIPTDLSDFDFCWSICALEHLGSIEKGITFIEKAMETLKPGGVAVHTTEFNFLNDVETIDNWPTVLFQRRHFEELRQRLNDLGHDVAPMDFDVGSKPLDRFIDMPPWPYEQGEYERTVWGRNTPPAHIKLNIDGFVSTCFGLIIRRNGRA